MGEIIHVDFEKIYEFPAPDYEPEEDWEDDE